MKTVLCVCLMLVLIQVSTCNIQPQKRYQCQTSIACCPDQSAPYYCANSIWSNYCCPMNWSLDCGFLGAGTCYCKSHTGKTKYGSSPKC